MVMRVIKELRSAQTRMILVLLFMSIVVTVIFVFPEWPLAGEQLVPFVILAVAWLAPFMWRRRKPSDQRHR